MKRLLVLGAAAAAVLLAVRHPAAPPAIVGVSSAPPAASQHSRKGHPAAASSIAVVYVVGAVPRPGLYRLAPGARVNDAVKLAGGLRADADPAAVNLADRVSDGEEIRVLRMGESVPAATQRSKRKASKRRTAAAIPAPQATFDLNAADANTLASVPGIGATLAARIVEYRRLNGPFASLDELADVAGMTQRRIDAMSAYATVGSMP